MARESLKLLSVNLSVPETRRRIQMFVGAATGIYDIIIAPKKPRRTDAQNRYIHGVIFPMIAAAMKEAGTEEADPDYAKNYLKCEFLKEPVIDPRTGEQIGSIILETKGISVERGCQFIDDCIRHAAQFWDIIVPPPSTEEIADWRKK